MPLLGTRGAASAKGFGFTNPSGSTFTGLAENFAVCWMSGSTSNSSTFTKLISETGTLIRNNYNSSYTSSYIDNANVFGGFDTAFSTSYPIARTFITTVSSGTDTAGYYFLQANGCTSAAISSSNAFITATGSIFTTTNTGTTFTNYNLNTLTGLTVQAGISAITKTGVAYLLLLTGASSPYSIKVYSTTNGSTFTLVGTFPTTNNYNWFNDYASFYNYDTGEFFTSFQTYTPYYKFNLNTLSLSEQSSTNAKIGMCYYNGFYYGISGRSIQRSADLNTWTTIYTYSSPYLPRSTFPLKNRVGIAGIDSNTEDYFFVDTWNPVSSSMANAFYSYTPAGYARYGWVYPIFPKDNFSIKKVPFA